MHWNKNLCLDLACLFNTYLIPIYVSVSIQIGMNETMSDCLIIENRKWELTSISTKITFHTLIIFFLGHQIGNKLSSLLLNWASQKKYTVLAISHEYVIMDST